jgi:uncharacterized protein (DUF1330 family)
MPAYVIFIRERTTDQGELDAHSKVAGDTFAGQPVKVLAAYGAQEVLEGPATEGVVLVEFPSMAEAKAWYDGPGYRQAREIRFRGAEYRAILFEGL